MKTAKGIFFDNDGVLVDTERLYFEANRRMCAGLGLELTMEMFVRVSLVEGRSIFDAFPDLRMGPDERERRREERDELYSEILYKERRHLVYPGTRELLEEVSRDRVTAIVTSCRRDHFKIIHEESGLLEYFDFVVSEGDYKNFKPHPEPYLRALERSGLRREECLAVEDSERGLRSAVAAGLRCVVVSDGSIPGVNFDLADRVIGEISGLRDCLGGV